MAEDTRNGNEEHAAEAPSNGLESTQPPADTPAVETSTAVTPTSPVRARKGPAPIDNVVSFTRQRTLPPKPKAEEARHLKELGSMQKAAHEAKVRKERDLYAHQQRKEATLARALPVWESDILPSWRAVLRAQRLRDLWWFGTMPQTARPRLWQSVIGNQLALAKSDYARAVQRLSKPDKEEAKQALQDSIRLASAHVFPDLRLFQENRPMHDDLVDLASAVCVHYSIAECPEEGIIDLAASLLLHLSPPDAFVAQVNVYEKSLLKSFHFNRNDEVEAYYRVFDTLLADAMPSVYANFSRQSLRPSLYLQPWLNTIYTKFVDLDTATRIFDIWLLEGDSFLFRVALALLHVLEARLFNPDRAELALVFAGRDKGAMAIASRERNQEPSIVSVYDEMGCTEDAIFQAVKELDWREESWARLVERELPD